MKRMMKKKKIRKASYLGVIRRMKSDGYGDREDNTVAILHHETRTKTTRTGIVGTSARLVRVAAAADSGAAAYSVVNANAGGDVGL